METDADPGSGDASAVRSSRGAPSPLLMIRKIAIPGGLYAAPVLALLLPFLAFSVAASVFGALVGAPFGVLTKVQDSPPLQGLVFAVAAAVHVLAARIYAWQVESIMRQHVDPQAQGQDAMAGTTATQAASEGGGARATTSIEFRIHGASAESLIDTPGERYIRDRLLNRRGKIFFACVMMGLVASAVVAAREWFVLWRAEGQSMADVPWHAVAQLFFPYAVGAVLLVALYLQRLSVGIRSALVVGIMANAWPLLFAFAARFGESSGGEVPAGLYVRTIGSYLGAVAVGIALSLALTRSAGSASWSGKRLLVLRVFGVDRNTSSLFSLIVRRWPFLGPVVTVVDPTFAKVTFGRLRYLLLFVLALPWLLMGMLMPTTLPTLPVSVAAYYAAWLPVVCAFQLWRLRVSAGRNLAAVRQRLDFDTASPLRLRYPAIQLTCFADVWKSTVGALVDWSDAILMDLRGFTAGRQGVAYEMRYLVDHCALSRIAFLTDATTDMPLFRATLQAQWVGLDPRSPNAGVERPVVHVYAAGGTGRGLRREMRPLLALLGELTTTAPAHRVPAAATERERARNRRVSWAIVGAWGMLAVGALLQVTVNWDGMRLGSGICVMWLAVLALMLTTRTRRLLVRDGSLHRLWRDRAWSIPFALLALGWLQWYVFVPLQN